MCQSCLDTLECGVDALPINFTAHQLTESKDKGNLRYVNWNVFKLLSVVEKSVLGAYESRMSVPWLKEFILIPKES